MPISFSFVSYCGIVVILFERLMHPPMYAPMANVRKGTAHGEQ
jgi:hypothetical protein